MNKTVGIIIGFGLVTWAAASSAFDFGTLDATPFVAPAVVDHTKFQATLGQIVVDTNSSAFYGYTGATWKSMSPTPISPTLQIFTSGSGTYYLTYNITVASASATAGATYSNNSQTCTVESTISSATTLIAYCTGDIQSPSGVLTKATGSGDSTITFTAWQKPRWIKVKMVGGGGGGRGTNGSPGNGGNGGNSTFSGTGVSLTASGGAGGLQQNSSNAGGSASGGDINIVGGLAGIAAVASTTSGNGGGTPLGLGGTGTVGSGSPGGAYGAGGSSGAYNGANSAGGTGGGYVEKLITSLSSSYSYAVGTAGSAGAGSSWAGGAGAAGIIIVEELYQ